MTRTGHGPRSVVAALGWVSFLVAVSACSTGASRSGRLRSLDELPEPVTTMPPTTAADASASASPSRQQCEAERLATKSYAPDPLPPVGEMPPGTFMREIAERGWLRVGVDENTLGLAAGTRPAVEIEGFEVDLATRSQSASSASVRSRSSSRSRW